MFSIGTDIVSTLRIKKLITENGDKFLNKIYTDKEIEYCNSNSKPYIHLSGKYAAKEAFVKALGTGFRYGINFKNIEIKNDILGKPFIKIDKTLSHKIKKKHKIKNFNIFLSLSDENKYAIASIVITK